jgi:hypothetical protein
VTFIFIELYKLCWFTYRLRQEQGSQVWCHDAIYFCCEHILGRLLDKLWKILQGLVKKIIILTSLLLGEASVFAYMIAKITTREQVHDQIQIFTVLECIIHIDNEGIMQLCKNLSLIHHRLNAALSNDTSFRHFLHRIRLLSLFSLNLPYLTESSLSNAV